MKTIRILRSTGRDLPRFSEGQVVDVQDDMADLLCGLRVAELLKAIPTEPLQAIPENPSILAAEAKLKQIKDGWLGGEDVDESVEPLPLKPKRQPKPKPEIKE